MAISSATAFRWMVQDFTDDKLRRTEYASLSQLLIMVTPITAEA